MIILPVMKTALQDPPVYQFHLPRFDTLLRVEQTSDHVLIRASRNTLNEEQKIRFIRRLVAEGFIPDHYQWQPLAGPGGFLGARWKVDYSWLLPDPQDKVRAERKLWRVLFAASAVWLATMGAVISCAPLRG